MARKYKRDANGRFAGGGSKAPTRAATSWAKSVTPRGTISKSAERRANNADFRSEFGNKTSKLPADRLVGIKGANPMGKGPRLPARKGKTPSRITTEFAKTTAPRDTISKRKDGRAMNRDFKSETTAKERRAPDRTVAAWNSKPTSRGRKLPRRRTR